jgi:hypothetical protein
MYLINKYTCWYIKNTSTLEKEEARSGEAAGVMVTFWHFYGDSFMTYLQTHHAAHIKYVNIFVHINIKKLLE